MSLELIKEAIRVNQIAGEEVAQTIIETDIIVPDVKPDISRVLLLDGDVFVNGTEAAQDRVALDGVFRYKILYAPEGSEDPVKSIVGAHNFDLSIGITGVRQGMKTRALCEVEHVEYEILNGRKLNIKAVLKVSANAGTEVDHNLAYDLEGLDDLQIQRKSYGVNAFLGSAQEEAIVNEALEVPAGKPAIREILRNDVKITGKDVKITEGKVFAKGDLNISTLYISDDESRLIQYMEHEQEFSQFIDLGGINEGDICDLDFRINDYNFEVGEDNDGELRVVNAKVSISLNVQGYQRKGVEVIEDAYSPKARVMLEKETIRMEENTFESRAQVSVKDSIFIDSDYPEIAEVFNVISKPTLSDFKILDDRILIEGVINARVLYLANDVSQPIFCQERDIPFRQTIEAKGLRSDMDCSIDLDIEHSSYSMISSSEVEVRFNVNALARMTSYMTLPIISKASDALLDDKRADSQPSVTIYFAQPGDTLWKVAKRYYTTIADIQKINDITDQELSAGGIQIIIPKRMS